jgi:hypothetical protein
VIGPLIGAADVCAAVQTTLGTWLPSVILEEAAYTGLDALPTVATFEQLPDESASTTAQFPAVIVSSPGLQGSPERHGDGSYTAEWQIVVSFILRSNSYTTTANLTRRYAVLVRTALAQHPTLGGFAESTTWTDEDYARLASNVARTLAMGHVTFTVRVADVLNDQDGPTTPPEGLNPDAPTARDVEITVTEETS